MSRLDSHLGDLLRPTWETNTARQQRSTESLTWSNPDALFNSSVWLQHSSQFEQCWEERAIVVCKTIEGYPNGTSADLVVMGSGLSANISVEKNVCNADSASLSLYFQLHQLLLMSLSLNNKLISLMFLLRWSGVPRNIHQVPTRCFISRKMIINLPVEGSYNRYKSR